MHKNWCKRKCSECTEVCGLDESLYCSPDCEHLGQNGEMSSAECSDCDAHMAKLQDEIPYERLLQILQDYVWCDAEACGELKAVAVNLSEQGVTEEEAELLGFKYIYDALKEEE